MWRRYERGEVEVSGEKTVKQTEKVITEAECENVVGDEKKRGDRSRSKRRGGDE